MRRIDGGRKMSAEEEFLRLILDISSLNRLGAQSRRVVGLLKSLDDGGPVSAADTGNSDLARSIREFCRSWDYKRGDLESALTAMSDSVRDATASFIEADCQMASVVRTAASTGAKTGRSLHG